MSLGGMTYLRLMSWRDIDRVFQMHECSESALEAMLSNGPNAASSNRT